MKQGVVDLHTNTKRSAVMVIVFSLLSFLLLLTIGITVEGYLGQLVTLTKSTYQYSVTMQQAIGCDDYYQLHAGISFATSPETNRGINADVVMQIPDSSYTTNVFWNTSALAENEVAITSDIARRLGLKTGSYLYSKHVVDGTMRTYTVAKILPEASSIRTDSRSSTNGIIIMGYDTLYLSNITASTVVFTDRDLNRLQDEFHETPENIVYRDDEITLLKNKLIPFGIVMVIFPMVLSALFVWLLIREFKHYFRRLIMLGYRKKTLNYTFVSYIIRRGLGAIFTTVIFSGAVFPFLGNLLTMLALLPVIVLSEFISMIVVTFAGKHYIWRA